MWEAVQFFIDSGWSFLTCCNIPGTSISPAEALLCAAFIPISIRFLRSALGLGSAIFGSSAPTKRSTPESTGLRKVD